MNRVGIVAIAVVLTVSLGVSAFWSFSTCRFLDRLFGVSSCVSLTKVENFDELWGGGLFATPLLAQSSASSGRLFGFYRQDGIRYPAMIKLDIESGEELERIDLTVSGEFDRAFPAQDGLRAMLSCRDKTYCTVAEGKNSVIVSLETGAVLEALDSEEDGFPGEPTIPVGFESLALQAGPNVVSYRRGDSIELRAPDRSLIAVLSLSEQLTGTRAFSVSPSGRYLAVLEIRPRAPVHAGVMVWIFDTNTGKLLHRFATDPSYAVPGPAVWHSDERHISLSRSSRMGVEIGRFALPVLNGR